MTILQQINTLIKDNIPISISIFYKIMLTNFSLLFILITFATPFSFAKLISLVLLLKLLIITSLLAFGNYQEQKIVKNLERVEDNKIQVLSEEIKIKKPIKKENPIKDFIA